MRAGNQFLSVESVLFLAIIALAGFLHFTLQINAGAFWRDEWSSILLAGSNSWGEVFAGLATDSFPALWVSLLRIWGKIGGFGEPWLRSIGFWLSLGSIAALWYAARSMKLPIPVFAGALLAFNPSVFYWGDSLRAYSLAMLLVILLFAFVWQFCETGGGKSFAIATGMAILAAQSNYQSSYLILAICLAGACVCMCEKLWARSLAVLGVGGIAALSLIPYQGVIAEYGKVGAILKLSEVSLKLFWGKFAEGFENTSLAFALLGLAYACSLGMPVFYRLFDGKRQTGPVFLRTLYASLCLLIAPVGCYFFARKAGFSTQSWYYIPLLGLLAIGIETALSDSYPYLRKSRPILASLLIITCIVPVWKSAHLRRTNMDLATARVAEVAAEKDFVFLNPCWESISFQAYYKGKAPWSILPWVPEKQRGEPYLAILPLMTSPDPLKETFGRIEQTLRGGGKVFVVGGLPALPENATPPQWFPAPHPVYGWQNWAYMQIWALHTSFFLQHHALHGESFPIESKTEISPFEKVEAVFVYQGWR